MGRSKATLRYSAGPPPVTFLDRAIQLARVGCPPGAVAVVTSTHLARTDWPPDLITLSNRHPERGMFSSLQLGARFALGRTRPSRLLVLLVDHPLVEEDTVASLWAESDRRPGAVLLPCHGRRLGHPVLLPLAALEAVCAAPAQGRLDTLLGTQSPAGAPPSPVGGEQLLSPATPARPFEVWAIAVDDPGVVTNINTPEIYRRLIGPLPDRGDRSS
jgi:CTP:molybdopterin cytidylyltransferase MocA